MKAVSRKFNGGGHLALALQNGKCILKTALWATLLLTVLSSQLWAQTEASMCVSVTDICCDTGWSSADYTIPANQQITKTHFHYEGKDGNRVKIECYDVNGGVETFLWSSGDQSTYCGCGESFTTTSHPISQNQTLRFKVRCLQCATGNCVTGSTVVTFASNSSYTTCLPDCNQE